MKKEDYQPIPIMELALKKYDEQNYEDCIHILRYQYKDLDKDPIALNRLSLCYASLNNLNEALMYINKAITLVDSEPLFYLNKGLYLIKSHLFFDGIKCYNYALTISKDEKKSEKISDALIQSCDILVSNLDLIYIKRNTKLFEEHLYYLDSLINSKYCVFELKKKYIQLKEQAVSYFFKWTKIYFDGFSEMTYEELALRCTAILNVTNLRQDIKNETEELLDICNNSINTKNLESNFIDDLINKGYSEEEIKEAFSNRFPNSLSFYSIREKIEKKKLANKTVFSNASPNSHDKRFAISEMMNQGYTKSEMIEGLSCEFGISEASARATINSYYKDGDLQLDDYFDNLSDDDDFDEEDE